MILSNYKIIKKLVEKHAKIEDLSVKGNKKHLALSRCVYYRICKVYQGKKYSHTEAAKAIGRCHNNSIYGLKSFSKFRCQIFFEEYINIAFYCTVDLSEIENKINNLIIKETKNKDINYNTVSHCCTESKDKKIKDLLNWVKSDLAQETNVKLGKTATPYRTEKLKFLNKLLEIESL